MAIHAISQSLMAKLVSMHKNGFQTTKSPDKKKTKTKTYIAKGWMESSFQKMGDKCRTVQSFTVDIKFNLSHSFQDLSLCLIYAVGVFIYPVIGATF